MPFLMASQEIPIGSDYRSELQQSSRQKKSLMRMIAPGDNFAATFSPDLADITLYVISVAQREKMQQGWSGHIALRLASHHPHPISHPMSAPAWK